jgi:pyruvate/2-oxoglutarate dehydrogenase complex dihydrolipoamide acyltransferase (E2) component
VTKAGKPRPRSRWPLALLSILLVLLAGVAIATAQLYWEGLRMGVGQMRASIAAAQEQQRQLLERLRAAEGALAQRAAAPQTPASPATTSASGTSATAAPPAGGTSLRRALPADERGRLMARLRELTLAAGRLSSAPGPGRWSPRPAPTKQLLREQLAIAAAAAGAGDVRLLDATLFAAERLTGPPHRARDDSGTALARSLAGLRSRLRVPAAVARHGPADSARPAR